MAEERNVIKDILSIYARLVSLGRYGRTKRMHLGIPPESISEIYTSDPWVGQL